MQEKLRELVNDCLDTGYQIQEQLGQNAQNLSKMLDRMHGEMRVIGANIGGTIINYEPKHFCPEEFVPPEIYTILGDSSIRLIDPTSIGALQVIWSLEYTI